AGAGSERAEGDAGVEAGQLQGRQLDLQAAVAQAGLELRVQAAQRAALVLRRDPVQLQLGTGAQGAVRVQPQRGAGLQTAGRDGERRRPGGEDGSQRIAGGEVDVVQPQLRAQGAVGAAFGLQGGGKAGAVVQGAGQALPGGV